MSSIPIKEKQHRNDDTKLKVNDPEIWFIRLITPPLIPPSN
jgi:hypothetical protein